MFQDHKPGLEPSICRQKYGRSSTWFKTLNGFWRKWCEQRSSKAGSLSSRRNNKPRIFDQCQLLRSSSEGRQNNVATVCGLQMFQIASHNISNQIQIKSGGFEW